MRSLSSTRERSHYEEQICSREHVNDNKSFPQGRALFFPYCTASHDFIVML